MSVEIHSRCEEKFTRMKDVFTRHFEDGLNIGASVAANLLMPLYGSIG